MNTDVIKKENKESTPPSKEVVEWTREKTLTLIEEYRKRPGLWDMTHEDYRKKDAKKELLDQVAQELNRAFPMVEIEKKFHTLRTQYHREVNRMNQIRGNEPYKSKWFAYNHLDFLSSPNACRSSRSSTAVKVKIEKTETESNHSGTITATVGEDDDDDEQPATKFIIKSVPVHATYTTTTIPAHTIQTEFITATNSSHHHFHNNKIASTNTEQIEIETTTPTAIAKPSPRVKEIRRITRKELETLIEDATKNVEDHSESESEQPNQPSQPRMIIKEVSVPSGYNNHHQVTTVAEHRILQGSSNSFEAHQQTDDMMDDNHDTSGGSGVQIDDNSYNQSSYQNQIKIASMKSSPVFHQQSSHQQQQTQQQQQQQQRHQGPRTITDQIYEEVVYDDQQQQQQPNSGSMKKFYYETKMPVRDELTIFGEYVANELRFITNRDILVRAKHKINVALFEASTSQLSRLD